MTLTIQRTVSLGHRLPSYDGICSSPHGHNARFEVRVTPLNGFVDFKKLDQALEQVVSQLDHAMVLVFNDPLIDVCRQHNWRCVSLGVEPTTEIIAEWVYFQLTDILDPRVVSLHSVTMHETDKYSATYGGGVGRHI